MPLTARAAGEAVPYAIRAAARNRPAHGGHGALSRQQVEEPVRAVVMHAPGGVRVDEVADGYRAMDERRATKALLSP